MHKIADSLSVTIILNQSHHVFDILPSGSFKNGGFNLKRERLKLDMERTFFFLVKLRWTFISQVFASNENCNLSYHLDILTCILQVVYSEFRTLLKISAYMYCIVVEKGLPSTCRSSKVSKFLSK